MESTSRPVTTIDETTDTTSLFGCPYNVILFNDDSHAFSDVVFQVQRAVKCTIEEAERITHEAHNKGEAVAFSGHKERCEYVDSILSGPPLKLRTAIRQ